MMERNAGTVSARSGLRDRCDRRSTGFSKPSAWPGDSQRVSGDYLRKQAATCLAWARECFDLETATRLRLMAEEFNAKANEIKANEIEASWNISSDSVRTPPGAAPFATGSDDS